jgi:hypothetical protein
MNFDFLAMDDRDRPVQVTLREGLPPIYARYKSMSYLLEKTRARGIDVLPCLDQGWIPRGAPYSGLRILTEQELERYDAALELTQAKASLTLGFDYAAMR